MRVPEGAWIKPPWTRDSYSLSNLWGHRKAHSFCISWDWGYCDGSDMLPEAAFRIKGFYGVVRHRKQKPPSKCLMWERCWQHRAFTNLDRDRAFRRSVKQVRKLYSRKSRYGPYDSKEKVLQKSILRRLNFFYDIWIVKCFKTITAHFKGFYSTLKV